MSLKIHKCAKLLTGVDREHQPFDGNWTREKTGQVISDQLVDQEIIKKLTEAEAGEVFPMK